MRRFLIGAGGLLMLAGAVVWLLVPVRYEAFALLKISGKAPSVLDARAATDDEFAVFKRTQAQLMLSSVVLTRTVGEPSISKLPTIVKHKDLPVAWLKSQLTIDYPDDSEVMRVTMRGTNPADMVKIVDMLVKKYQIEILQRERDRRLEHERKLTDAYGAYSRKYQEAATTLHQLELVNQTGSTQAAKIRKQFAEEELREAIASRHRLRQQLRDNAMQTVLQQAREQQASNVPTAAGDAAPSDKLTLPLLAAQKDFLEESIELADREVATAAKHIDEIENFSAQVSAKQEELAALRNTVTELRGTLDRLEVEKLAQERITVLDNATLANPEGDYWPRAGYAQVMGLVGLGVFVLGLSRRQAG